MQMGQHQTDMVPCPPHTHDVLVCDYVNLQLNSLVASLYHSVTYLYTHTHMHTHTHTHMHTCTHTHVHAHAH